MQVLYGYYTSRESLKYVFRDKVKHKFTPNALVHDLSDTENLNKYRLIALRAYDQNLFSGKIDKMESPLPEEVYNTVNDAIIEYHKTVTSESVHRRKSMIEETKNIQIQYFKFLMLAGEFQFIERQEMDRINPTNNQKNQSWKYNLKNNPIIDSINSNEELHRAITSNKLNWQTQANQLRFWYQNILKKDERFLVYQKNYNPSEEDHRDILKYLFKNLLFKNEIIASYFEEKSINWTEDKEILRSMLAKTIIDYDGTIKLKTVSINEKEDFDFFEKLFKLTLEDEERLECWIAEKTKNWDVSRLAQTDRIILKMALTEMIHFRSIPIKVTINEFIEICKQYSTPKSKQFVNGILDVLANQLTSEGIIKKSGRGLVDNK